MNGFVFAITLCWSIMFVVLLLSKGYVSRVVFCITHYNNHTKVDQVGQLRFVPSVFISMHAFQMVLCTTVLQ